jgi:hypothetical protein
LCIDWIIFDQDYFGKEIVRRRNTDPLNGVLFVAQEIKEGMVFMTLTLRTWPLWVNCVPDYLPKMGYDKPSQGKSMLAQV